MITATDFHRGIDERSNLDVGLEIEALLPSDIREVAARVQAEPRIGKVRRTLVFAAPTKTELLALLFALKRARGLKP